MARGLDEVTRQARYAMVLGSGPSQRRDADRVLQYGLYDGRLARHTLISAGGESEQFMKPRFAEEREFDEIVAQYDADPRWLRLPEFDI